MAQFQEWNVPFQDGPSRVSTLRFLTTVGVLAALGAAYQGGLVVGARLHVGVEIAITVGLPLLVWASGLMGSASPRILQLFLFESGYNALTILNRSALALGLTDLAWLVGVGFVVFFVVQAAGFLAFEVRQRRPLGVVASVCMSIVVFWWAATCADLGGSVDADGRFLMWGEDAPWILQGMYATWIVNAVVGDLTDVFPRTVVLHGVSVAVALASGEFFHARLLTASNLFLLDLAFNLTRNHSSILPDDFAGLPPDTRRWLFERLRVPLSALSTLGCIGWLGYALFFGLTG